MQLLLSGGGGGSGGAAPADPPGTIRITQAEKEAIDRLSALGFERMRAAEAYFACDKNEEMVANFLFENAATDDRWYAGEDVAASSAAAAQSA